MPSNGERPIWAENSFRLPVGLDQGKRDCNRNKEGKAPWRKIKVPFTLGSLLPNTMKGAGDSDLLVAVSDWWEALGRGQCQLHYVYDPGLAGSGPAPYGELREWLSARWGTRGGSIHGGNEG